AGGSGRKQQAGRREEETVTISLFLDDAPMAEDLSQEEIEDLWEFYVRHEDNKPSAECLRVRGGFAALLRSLFEQECVPSPSAGLVAWIAYDIFGAVEDEIEHRSFLRHFNEFWRGRGDLVPQYGRLRSSWSPPAHPALGQREPGRSATRHDAEERELLTTPSAVEAALNRVSAVGTQAHPEDFQRLTEVDTGTLGRDGEPANVRRRVYERDGEPLEVDRGTLERDGEPLEVDRGTLERDGEPLEVSRGTLETDGEPLEVGRVSLERDGEEAPDGPVKTPDSLSAALPAAIRKSDESSPSGEPPGNDTRAAERPVAADEVEWKDLEVARLLKKVEAAEERRVAAEEVALSRALEVQQMSARLRRLEEALTVEKGISAKLRAERHGGNGDSTAAVEDQLAALHRSRACLATAVAAASSAVATTEEVWDRPAQLTSILFEVLDNAKTLAQSERDDQQSTWRDLFVDLCNILVQLPRVDKRAQRLVTTTTNS
ncbi:hypothetical protein FOZ62_023586, partial [Perkinsus olseni]